MPNTLVRFGEFELDLGKYELLRNGQPVKLERIPMELLILLVGSQGTLVTREMIIERLWGKDVYRETESGINTAINKLRVVLCDDPRQPRFLQTVIGKGYRFIAEVVEAEENKAPTAVVQVEERKAPTTVVAAEGHRPPTTRVKGEEPPPKASFFGGPRVRRILMALGIAALVLLSGFLTWTARKPLLSSVEVVPLIAMPGKQASPAFSPDGNQVAFTEHDGTRGGIYITMIGGNTPLQLTNNPGDCCPTWSPDGRQIAFVRTSESGKERSFYVIAALGGSERKLYAGPAEPKPECSRVDWSPDGNDLIFSEPAGDGSRSRITLLSLTDSATRQLTSPDSQKFDCQPAFSPDGSKVAFIRRSLSFIGDLFVLAVSGGSPKRLTPSDSAASPAWTADGREIVFPYVMGGGVRSLCRISASGGVPRPLAGVGVMAFNPSIARRGNELVYQHILRTDNIWRVSLKDERHVLGPPVPAFTARGFIRRPSFSPDGKRVVFESNRLGYSDIWECNSDGANCQQLTSLHGMSGTARWSPDGAHIVFESVSQAYYDVYLLDIPGGTPRLVATFPGADNGAPNWSRDGQWIYFYSAHKGGSYQIWKVPFKGGSSVQVTKYGGVYGMESDDRRFLYYSKFGQPGVWKMPLDGGEETRILDLPLTWYSWTLTSTGIYFLNSTIKPNGRIEFFDFATHQTDPILTLEKPASDFGGLAISSDHKTLLFGQTEVEESYLMLVKNFQ